MSQSNPHIAQRTRIYRKLHKWISISLLVFFALMSITGLLLGWKKQAVLLPKTQKGISNNSIAWIGVDSLQKIAVSYAQNTLQLDTEIDRIDIRPKKGIAKFVFAKHFTELQLDCTTGKVLSVAVRKSDFIEKLHDGSILDFWVSTDSEAFKLIYTSLVGLGLAGLTLSGFWLWYNPIRMRKRKRKTRSNSLHQ